MPGDILGDTGPRGGTGAGDENQNGRSEGTFDPQIHDEGEGLTSELWRRAPNGEPVK